MTPPSSAKNRRSVDEAEGIPLPRTDPRIPETRRLVKQATLALIAEVGFEGASIELISERSGVARSTIYRHWPDPSRLYLEAFDPPSASLRLPPLGPDAAANLRQYVEHVASRLNDDLFASALAAQVDKARRDPEYREAHLRYASERNELGGQIFRRGIAEGVLRADLDPEYETDLILAVLVYQRLHRYRYLDNTIIESLLSALLDRVLVRE